MIIEIKIAVKPIIKKYLSSKVKTDPMILSRTNAYGIFIYNCLVRMSGKGKASLVGVDTNKYPEVLKITVSEDMWRRKGWYMHPQKQIDFNKFIAKLLDDEFHYFMDLNTQVLGHKIYGSFLQFREKFDFTEDDLPIKTMEKNYERYRLGLTA
nr:hypothetical protein [Pedobacter sp. ASV19]